MSGECAICHKTYDDRYDERTCEECKRSVCVDHWGGLAGRICTDCTAKAEMAFEQMERDARAMRLMRRYGLSAGTRPPREGPRTWSVSLLGLDADDWRRLTALPAAERAALERVLVTAYDHPADAIIAACEAAGLTEDDPQ